jgi:hypothetical protein
MVGKAQTSHGAISGLYGRCSDGVPPIHFSKPNSELNSDLAPCDFRAFPTMKRELRGKKFRGDQRFQKQLIVERNSCVTKYGSN